eukprot:scaffold2388_cov57-Cyclotella_meneghiniana.AAC.3
MHVMKNVETATIEDSLLRPKGAAIYYSHDNDDCKDLQGVALYHDRQRARFISAVHVEGKEKSFLKQYKKDPSNSKDPTTELTRAYPYKKPSNPGGRRGLFHDLDMCAAFVVDPSNGGDNDCLTRVDGVFVWGEDLLRKLAACKVGRADSLQDKQRRLAICMIEFMYVLMMSQNGRITHAPFMPFMGRAVTLQKNRES